MRRLAAGMLAVVGLLVTSGVAGAQEETPVGTFSSPTRAVAGAPIWVRSITPCPVTAGEYQFVRVGISAQSEPSIEYIESTDDDLNPDGSWMVTLSAPADMPKGITKSYEIQAQCIEVAQPYLAPSRTPTSEPATEPATTGDPSFSYQRYFMRPLYVTGFGGSEAEVAGAPTGDTTTTTTTTTSTTTPASNTLAADSFESTALQSAGQHADLQAAGLEETPTTWVSDEAERAAEARAELARLTKGSDDVTLSAAPVVATTPRPAQDPGIPWWSFVLATMLAVGAVVGFGQRRRGVEL